MRWSSASAIVFSAPNKVSKTQVEGGGIFSNSHVLPALLKQSKVLDKDFEIRIGIKVIRTMCFN